MHHSHEFLCYCGAMISTSVTYIESTLGVVLHLKSQLSNGILTHSSVSCSHIVSTTCPNRNQTVSDMRKMSQPTTSKLLEDPKLPEDSSFLGRHHTTGHMRLRQHLRLRLFPSDRTWSLTLTRWPSPIISNHFRRLGLVASVPSHAPPPKTPCSA